MNKNSNDNFLKNEAFMNNINRLAIRLLSQGDKVFAISSLTKKEGKTTVAKYLAMALSNLHYSVCLVDLDMLSKREPESEKTIIDYLENKIELDAIMHTDLDYHYLLSDQNDNSVNLLASDKFVLMIDQLEKTYDFVILDCPSLIKNVDATLIAKQADSLVLVLERGKNSKEKIKNVLKQLARNNVKVSGAVFNK